MNSIFVVTVVNVYKNGKRLTDGWNGTRTWGWFPTFEEAEADIRADNNDLYFESGTYQYAVIEETPPGMMGFLNGGTARWFEVNHDKSTDTYEVIALSNAPPAFARVFGWGMG